MSTSQLWLSSGTEAPLIAINGVVKATKSSRDKSKEQFFTLYLMQSKKDVKCMFKGFLPLREQDIVSGYGNFDNTGAYKDTFVFSEAPNVDICKDKEIILQSIFRGTKSTSRGDARGYKFYDALITENGGEKGLHDYIDNLAENYSYARESIIQRFSSILTAKQLNGFISWWIKDHIKRKLWILGLTNKDISSCSYMSKTRLYEQLCSNPYLLLSLPMEICDSVMLRLEKQVDSTTRKAAVAARELDTYTSKYKHACVPVTTARRRIGFLDSVLEQLSSDYGVAEEYDCYYLRYQRIVETCISDHLLYLNELHNSVYDCDALMQHINAGMYCESCCDEQIDAMKLAIGKNISIITGGAGSGKTTIILTIGKAIHANGKKPLFVSFTGKAVTRIKQEMRRRGMRDYITKVHTMHFIIGAKKERQTQPSIPITDDTTEDILDFDHVIIDETSMVCSTLMYDFIKTFQDTSYKLTLVGDPNQLPPISWGSFFRQVVESNALPMVKLIQNHRQTEENVIGKNSLKILEGNPYLEETSKFRIHEGDIDFVKQLVVSFYENGVKGGVLESHSSSTMCIITPYNRDMVVLNDAAQEIYNPFMDKELKDGRVITAETKEQDSSVITVFTSSQESGYKKGSSRQGESWRVGDRIMLIKNSYRLGVMNGEEGEITGLFDGYDEHFKRNLKGVDVMFTNNVAATFYHELDEEDMIEEDKDDSSELPLMKYLQKSWCVTVHKTQGSEYDYVIFYLPRGGSVDFLNRPLAYTALTRAKKGMHCVCEDRGDLISMIKQEPFKTYENLDKRLKDGQISEKYMKGVNYRTSSTRKAKWSKASSQEDD